MCESAQRQHTHARTHTGTRAHAYDTPTHRRRAQEGRLSRDGCLAGRSQHCDQSPSAPHCTEPRSVALPTHCCSDGPRQGQLRRSGARVAPGASTLLLLVDTVSAVAEAPRVTVSTFRLSLSLSLSVSLSLGLSLCVTHARSLALSPSLPTSLPPPVRPSLPLSPDRQRSREV